MDTSQAYDLWSQQYDSNENRTRDLEAMALRRQLETLSFSDCLEIGCGTGKNTEWLLRKASRVMAADLSPQMLAKAKEKIDSGKVQFAQADITRQWDFGHQAYDLVVFSLVLEHIHNLDHVFQQAAAALRPGGHIYIGELHPFKQYAGSKARFETEAGWQVVQCYTHHLSDFIQAAKPYVSKSKISANISTTATAPPSHAF